MWIVFISFKLRNLEPTEGHFTRRFPVAFFFFNLSVKIQCEFIMHSQKITERMCSTAQRMVSRYIQNMPWRMKTSPKT